MVFKNQIPEAIEREKEAIYRHLESNQPVVNGMIPCVTVQRHSPRKYYVGWRFCQIGTPVGTIQKDIHPARYPDIELVWVLSLIHI